MFLFQFVLFLIDRGLAHFGASQRRNGVLIGDHRHGDRHVIDHAGHPIDVGGEFGDKALLGGVFGNAAQGDDPVRC